MTNSPELTDGVVVLTPFYMEDAEEHLDGEDIEMEKWVSGGKSTIDTVRNWIKRSQESWKKDGPCFTFAIRNAESNQLIGMIEANTDLKNIEGIKEGDANIAYGLYPRARRKGYMVRSIDLMLKFLKTKGIKRPVIRVDPQNTKSLTVPIRCGFIKTGEILTKKEGILMVFVRGLD